MATKKKNKDEGDLVDPKPKKKPAAKKPAAKRNSRTRPVPKPKELLETGKAGEMLARMTGQRTGLSRQRMHQLVEQGKLKVKKTEVGATVRYHFPRTELVKRAKAQFEVALNELVNADDSELLMTIKEAQELVGIERLTSKVRRMLKPTSGTGPAARYSFDSVLTAVYKYGPR